MVYVPLADIWTMIVLMYGCFQSPIDKFDNKWTHYITNIHSNSLGSNLQRHYDAILTLLRDMATHIMMTSIIILVGRHRTGTHSDVLHV
jgi:hypothetical protein